MALNLRKRKRLLSTPKDSLAKHAKRAKVGGTPVGRRSKNNTDASAARFRRANKGAQPGASNPLHLSPWQLSNIHDNVKRDHGDEDKLDVKSSIKLIQISGKENNAGTQFQAKAEGVESGRRRSTRIAALSRSPANEPAQLISNEHCETPKHSVKFESLDTSSSSDAAVEIELLKTEETDTSATDTEGELSGPSPSAVKEETEPVVADHKKFTPSVSALKDESSQDDDDDYDEDDYAAVLERRRLQNIQENAAFLAQINMGEARQSLQAVTKTPSSVNKLKPSSRGLKESRQEPDVLPRRKSLRLQRIDPKGQPLPPEPEEEEEEPARKPAGPLPMKDLWRNLAEAADTVADGFLSEIQDELTVEKCPSSGVEMTDDLKSFIKSVKKMSTGELNVSKVVPSRIFSMAIHPSETKTLIAAGDKWGRLGLWDMGSKEGQDGVICFEPHTRPIKQMTFHPQYPDRLYTSSYDGTMRCAMFETGVFDDVFSIPESRRNWLNGFDFTSPDSLLVCQGEGTVSSVDLRCPGQSMDYNLSHRSIKCISVHPGQPQYFVTSNYAGMDIYDLRKISKKKCQPVINLPAGRMVQSAYFSPITGKHLVSLGMDDTIGIFNTSEITHDKVNYKTGKVIRHFNHTGRWLTPLRPAWHPNREDVFVVGSMVKPRQIEMFGSDGQMLHAFKGDYLQSVCSLNVFHPTRDILAGGNSSGRVHVFM